MSQIFIISSIILCSISWLCLAEFIPPLEKEWDTQLYPDIFSDFPKRILDETKYSVKSRPDPIHKYLPSTTKPISYDLRLRIILESDLDEEELTAPGSVRIRIKCMQATDQIVMHADVDFVTIIPDTVKIDEVIFGKPTNRSIPVKNQTFEIDNDFYIIHLATPCKVNWEYFVNIGFVAQIATEELTGLYLSKYTDPATNITRRLATTQFEDEHSRKMFPNYDDPDRKATFKLTIGRLENLNSLSNMNLIKTEPINNLPGWYWDHYAPTPPMSSYLVALVVSDFTCESNHSIDYEKYVEVCGPPHMIEEGGGLHSTAVVATVLKFYDDFMKQIYPLPKMTSVAIPDFEAGAMENWGLNTYRIRGLIYWPDRTSESDRLRIDLTIAHELAHQNFGNLVTHKFWNQIYLNEGFATYISYFGLKSVSPEYEPEKQWMASYRRRALFTDGKIDTHPIVNVSNPASYFDGVSYSKGASLIKMMENFLTQNVFHEALQYYLAAHAYNTATQWNLFEVIERHAFTHGVYPTVASITEIMESWTLQPGYPVIRVDFISNQMIALSQERFFDQPPEAKIIPQYWYIPITTLTDKTKVSFLEKRPPTTWLSKMEPTTVMFIEEEFDWIIINSDASVFARVLYDDALIKRIQKYLNVSPKIFSALSRAQIIEDSFELAWAGYSRIETALDFTKYLGNEHEPIVWSAALNGLGKIYGMLVDDEAAFETFKEYVLKKISASLSITGVEQLIDERGVSVLHRASMLSWAGILNLPEAINYASKLIQPVNNSVPTNGVPPDLHSQTYCNAIIGGDKEVYHSLLTAFRYESDNDIKDVLARSLGCSTDIEILEELQKNVTDSSAGLPTYHSSQILLKLARNPLTRKTILRYLDENFDDIRDFFDGPTIIARTLEHAAQYWNTEYQLQELKAFLVKYNDEFPKLEKQLKRIINQVEKNIVWMQKFSDPIKSWFTENK
ncbi:unnamed protein product [Orchesella dallaii]|uniref:Aminopeptidase n=1 Tax=Orchesella dallaii TaxID=48710 RepID=A0ABP1RFT2_9HEXA